MSAAEYTFTSDELTSDLNKVKIVGERYTGQSAKQTRK